MGANPSLPNVKLRFSSNCCNEVKEKSSEKSSEKSIEKSRQDSQKDEKIEPKRGLVRSIASSWLRRSRKTTEEHPNFEKRIQKLAKRPARLQFAQTDAEKIPDEII